VSHGMLQLQRDRAYIVGFLNLHKLLLCSLVLVGIGMELFGELETKERRNVRERQQERL
jgi:hypothetical protein